MIKREDFLRYAQSLPSGEIARLIDELKRLVAEEELSRDIEVGRHGLAAWTESTRDEDWSEFYPQQLRSAENGSI